MSTLLSAHRSIVGLVVVFAFGLMALPVQAQETGTITGTVTDAQNAETLPGANVSIVGTQRGTATNAQGQFTIENVEPGLYSLRASFVGFQPQVVEEVEVTAGEETQVDFELRASQETLEEVVVVGYGTQNQRDITGSVAKIDSASFNPGTHSSPEGMIQGKVSGLQITSGSGRPGEKPLIRLRGGSSINASSEPLFVLDGVPISNEGTSGGRNPLNFIDPSNVENITVLKDASATAIYGSRAANGVILIETKQGGGNQRVTYNGSVSTANPVDRPDVLSGEQYRNLVNGLLIEGYSSSNVQNKMGEASTDWFEEVTRSSVTQDHSVSLSGGEEARSYRFSLGYFKEQGIVHSSNTERANASLSYKELFFDESLTINANVKASRTRDQFAPGGTVGNALFFDPTHPVRDSTSQFEGFFEWPANLTLSPSNPVAEYRLTQNTGEQYRSLGNVKFEYNLPVVEGLTARLNLGYDINSGENEFFAPTSLRSQQAPGGNPPGEVARRNFTRVNLLTDAYFEYSRTFDAIDSDVNATLGYSYQDFTEEYPEFQAFGLATNILEENSTSPASEQTTFVAELNNRLISGFGRLNYSFKNRYLLTLTVRRDGSSRFGPRNRWGTFPSASLAWRITNEPFMEDLTPTISNLKLRGSWGITGNQEIGDFQYVSTFNFSGDKARAQFGDEFLTMLRPTPADPGLKWEETRQTNVGLTFGFLDDRLNGNIEWYQKDTNDLIFNALQPAFTNVGDLAETNIGSVRNTGWEFELDATVFETDNASWNASLNAASNNNEVLDITRANDPLRGGIAGGTGNQIQILRQGEPAYSFFLYEHKMCNGHPCRATDFEDPSQVRPLDIYRDVAGGGEDGNEPDGAITRADRTLQGTPFPDWTFGHSQQFRYEGLDFSFTLRSQLGNKVYNNNASNAGSLSSIVSGDGVPVNLHESVLEYQFRQKRLLSNVYLEDASFLKLDNVTLGYSFDQIPSVKRLRVYGRVENALVLTGYSGPRPEIGFGIDNNTFPRSRTWTAGISLNF